MDQENCREREQDTRQKKPFQGDNQDLLLRTSENEPLEEEGRYEPRRAVHLRVRNQAPPVLSQEEYSLLMQITFGLEVIIPVIHYILPEYILLTLKSVSLCC